MKSIIMAAGVGSRISRMVQKPKSILGVENTTIIGHTVQMLINKGIDVAVVVGYRKEEIFDALKDYPVTYFFNPFFKVTNSIASLWFARSFISKDKGLILCNADVFWEKAILDELMMDSRKIVVLADKKRVKEGDYFLFEENEKVKGYGKELSNENRNCEYVGVAKIESDFVETFLKKLTNTIEEEEYNLWWENILWRYSEKNDVFIKDVGTHFWAEVDFIEDYERILKYWTERKQ